MGPGRAEAILSSAPTPPTVTSTTTGAATCAKSTNASTTRATEKAMFSPPNQLTLKEPHPMEFLPFPYRRGRLRVPLPVQGGPAFPRTRHAADVPSACSIAGKCAPITWFPLT